MVGDIWAKFMGYPAGEHFLRHLSNVYRKRICKTAESGHRQKISSLPNIDYGPMAEDVDLPVEEMKMECERIIHRLQVCLSIKN